MYTKENVPKRYMELFEAFEKCYDIHINFINMQACTTKEHDYTSDEGYEFETEYFFEIPINGKQTKTGLAYIIHREETETIEEDREEGVKSAHHDYKLCIFDPKTKHLEEIISGTEEADTEIKKKIKLLSKEKLMAATQYLKDFYNRHEIWIKQGMPEEIECKSQKKLEDYVKV